MHNISEMKIRRILAKLYDNHEKARMIASDAGLQVERIAFPSSSGMDVCWDNIWREAKLQHKDLKLIELVQEVYPQDEEIAQIRDQIIQQRKQSQSTELRSEHQAIDNQITLFYSYAHNDEALRKELEKHLSLLRNQGLIAPWSDRDINAGTEWANLIDDHLDTAHIILLLISPDFLASKYCYSIEMKRALERHRAGEARVIPILLRPVDWRDAPFSMLQALPRNAQPVTTWKNRDLAFEDIAKQIRRVVDELRRGK